MSATTRVAVKANATGKATFDFPAVPSGTSRVGTVVVPLATAGAKSIVAITGQDFCALLGGGGGGPVPVRGSGRLTVTTTGLLSTVTYTAVFNYVQHTGSTTPPATAVLAPATAFSETTFTGKVTAKITGPVTVETAATKPIDISGPVTISGVPKVAFTGNQPVTIEASSATVTTKITEVITGVDFSVVNKATTILQVGNHFDNFAERTNTSAVARRSASVTIPAITVKSNYGAVLVLAYNNTATTITTPVTVAVESTASGNRKWVAPLLSNGTFPQATVPGAFDGGYAITVTVYYATAVAGKTVVLATGLTSNPGVQLRSDGRAYPIGSHGASSQAGTTPVNVVAAPTSPLRILVKSMSVESSWLVGTKLGARRANLYGTINGASVTLLTAVAAGHQAASGNATLDPPGGILLDAATSLTVASTAVNGTAANFIARASVTYDLVV